MDEQCICVCMYACMHVFVYACMLYLFTSELVPITPDSVRTWALIHAPLMYSYSCTRIFVCSAREYLHEKNKNMSTLDEFGRQVMYTVGSENVCFPPPSKNVDARRV